MANKFSLNGEEVTIKDLNLGDLKAMQKLIKGKDEIDYPTILIGYCCGISSEEFDKLPINCLAEITEISDYIGNVIEGK